VITANHGEEIMLTTLLESNAARSRRVGGTLASTLVHAAVIATAIALTLPNPGEATDTPTRPDTIIFVTPMGPRPAEARRASPDDRFAPPTLPDPTRTSIVLDPKLAVDAGPDVFVPNTEPGNDVGPALPGNGIGSSAGLGEHVGGVVDERLVDRAPRLIGHAEPPIFPPALRLSGRSGRVVVQFVVDTLGRAESGDVRFVESSDPLFNDAVRAALPRYQFSPGEAGGRKVRTLVQLPFDFSLVR
jgi:protein TonB